MEGGERESPPFWTRTLSSSSSSSSSSANSNSNSIIILVIILLLSIFVILFYPSFISSSSFKDIRFKPTTLLRNWWDQLNFVLVVFAILCGLLGINNTSSGPESEPERLVQPTPTLPAQNYSVETNWAAANGPIRRMRSSSSYPDFRQEASWGPQDDSWRFYDDVQLYHRRSQRNNGVIKNIPVVEEVQKESTPPPYPPPPERSRSPPPPPPPPPPPLQQRQPRKRHVRKLPPESTTTATIETRSDPPPPPPPPPMTPPRPQKLHRKKSSGAKDFAAAISHFYQKKRKGNSSNKMKKIHSEESIDSRFPSTPPPPPPPPPPSSVFHSLFSHKKSGDKKKQRPPPPPPPPPKPKHETDRSSRLTDYPLPYSPLRPRPPPPPPQKSISKTRERRGRMIEEYCSIPYSIQIAPPSPLPPPPPPPPPSPPVTLISNLRGCGVNDEEKVFCPSPDVNNKAEMFIARFRAGLKTERINSIKKKEQIQIQEQQ